MAVPAPEPLPLEGAVDGSTQAEEEGPPIWVGVCGSLQTETQMPPRVCTRRPRQRVWEAGTLISGSSNGQLRPQTIICNTPPPVLPSSGLIAAVVCGQQHTPNKRCPRSSSKRGGPETKVRPRVNSEDCYVWSPVMQTRSEPPSQVRMRVCLWEGRDFLVGDGELPSCRAPPERYRNQVCDFVKKSHETRSSGHLNEECNTQEVPEPFPKPGSSPRLECRAGSAP